MAVKLTLPVLRTSHPNALGWKKGWVREIFAYPKLYFLLNKTYLLRFFFLFLHRSPVK
jgi:hypothetical protein